jgi:carbamoyl-phosphate synthase large subunit
MKIAVSGIGGGAGQSVIKALYETEYEIIGLDGETHATGLYAVGTGYRIPYANSPEFVPALLAILKKENCTLMFPGLDAELPVLARHRANFEREGIQIVVSTPSVVDIADDKLLTPAFLSAAGLPSPLTCEFSDFLAKKVSLPFPIILKPKKGGARSKNVFLVKNEKDLAALNLVAAEFIAQEYIEGDEYTCGSVSFDGECFGTIAMRRILRDGDTYKCFVEFDSAIDTIIRTVVSKLKPFGPLNVQLRLRDGVPYIFELNARCSGTTGARALSGFNEPGMIADWLLKRERRPFEVKKTTIFRYWDELVVENSLVEGMCAHQFVSNPRFSRL